MIQLLLLLGLIIWLVKLLPYVMGAIVVLWFAHTALGVWLESDPPPKVPEYRRFEPRYPDMPQAWNWAVHMYLLDEITVYELVDRDPYGRTVRP